MNTPDDRSLTDGEAEVMDALWNIREGGVREVLDAMVPGRDLAYTSVATWLKILEGKGFVSAKAAGRRLVYTPTLEREEYAGRSVRKLTSRWFGGDALSVLRQLVQGNLSEKDLGELRKMVDEKLGAESSEKKAESP